MTRTDENVSDLPRSTRVPYTPESAAQGVQSAIEILEGRWKLVILFQLFGGQVQRFSDLERAIPGVSQKMLIQQLRQLDADGVVAHRPPPGAPEGGVPLDRMGAGALPGA